ncbi:MAG: hypothetical protein GY708_19030 [Actinomycetia bacterium]|nr:hypothetical protein [Actinomycetes bacterium]MCP4961196.1 hypothetical protein [Actinomycetes bacterium]
MESVGHLVDAHLVELGIPDLRTPALQGELDQLLDLVAHNAMAAEAIAHWVQRWVEHTESHQVADLWPRLKPVALLQTAWVYQRFLDNIEPSEHIYHRDEVSATIKAAL